MSEPPDSTDQRLDEALGRLLRGGVILAAVVVLIGGVAVLVSEGRAPEDHHTFHGEPPELTSPIRVIPAVGALNARAVIQLGLLLLIATPVARVAFSAYAFTRQRDWTYVVVTLIVLGLLLYSLFWGT
jgi:uncharacterized membrane protein